MIPPLPFVLLENISVETFLRICVKFPKPVYIFTQDIHVPPMPLDNTQQVYLCTVHQPIEIVQYLEKLEDKAGTLILNLVQKPPNLPYLFSLLQLKSGLQCLIKMDPSEFSPKYFPRGYMSWNIQLKAWEPIFPNFIPRLLPLTNTV